MSDTREIDGQKYIAIEYLEAANETARRRGAERDRAITERDTAVKGYQAVCAHVAGMREEIVTAEATRDALAEALRDTRELITQSELQCPDILDDGECGGTVFCLFHQSIARIDAALALVQSHAERPQSQDSQENS